MRVLDARSTQFIPGQTIRLLCGLRAEDLLAGHGVVDKKGNIRKGTQLIFATQPNGDLSLEGAHTPSVCDCLSIASNLVPLRSRGFIRQLLHAAASPDAFHLQRQCGSAFLSPLGCSDSSLPVP